MSLSVIVTNHDYGRFLDQCLASAVEFADEVLVYDDGSTDDSLAVITDYPVTVTHQDEASGGPVWGSNLGIEQATSTHLMFLDADNWLVTKPPEYSIDYTFAPIPIHEEDGSFRTTWEYGYWPLTASGCRQRFLETRQMPYPWGGVWRTDFLKRRQWRYWNNTRMAADFRTALDWLEGNPSLAYHTTPFLAFRDHAGSWSNSGERDIMQAEANAVVL